jgi:hypothetical protein
MKNFNYLGLLLFSSGLFLLVLTFGCVTPPEYPVVPAIEYVSMTKDTLPRGSETDSTLVTLSFTDGDGDIGYEVGGDNDLFFTDSRDGDVKPRKIPFVPELGASNGIKGKISFVIDNSCCIFPPPDTFYNGCYDVLPQHPYDSVTYSVYILDRQGNKSNTIQLPPIYIRCFE